MYANFAYIYDRLMQDIPYDKWVDYIKKIISDENITAKNVLDMGCGTGNVSIPMARMGFNVTALDLSPEMLSVAESKAREENLQIRFINQDMREVNIPSKFDLVLSMCDSMNYLTEEEDLQKTLKGAYELLEDNGILIFDLNSQYKIEHVFGENTYVLRDEDVSYIWENSYEPLNNTCEMDLTFFIRGENNLYSRFEETHRERAYLPKKVIEYLKEAGFHRVKFYEALTFSAPGPYCERIYFIALK